MLKQVSKFDSLVESLNLSTFTRAKFFRVIAAYADCCEVEAERNLSYFEAESFSVEEATKVLNAAIPHGYNAFNADVCLKRIETAFGKEARIFIAREGSVCLYVKPSTNVWIGCGRASDATRVRADECSFNPEMGLFRLWWD